MDTDTNYDEFDYERDDLIKKDKKQLNCLHCNNVMSKGRKYSLCNICQDTLYITKMYALKTYKLKEEHILDLDYDVKKSYGGYQKYLYFLKEIRLKCIEIHYNEININKNFYIFYMNKFFEEQKIKELEKQERKEILQEKKLIKEEMLKNKMEKLKELKLENDDSNIVKEYIKNKKIDIKDLEKYSKKRLKRLTLLNSIGIKENDERLIIKRYLQSELYKNKKVDFEFIKRLQVKKKERQLKLIKEMPNFRTLGYEFTRKADIYILTNKNYDELMNDYKELMDIKDNINKRRNELIVGLSKYNLKIRQDSKLCDAYIYENNDYLNPTLEETINTVVLMNFLYTKTNYKKLINDHSYGKCDISDYKTLAISEYIKKYGNADIPNIILKSYKLLEKGRDPKCFW